MKTIDTLDHRVRIAEHLRNWLQTASGQQQTLIVSSLQPVEDRLEQLQALRRQWRLAVGRGWSTAAGRLRERLRRLLGEIGQCQEHARNVLCRPLPRVPPLREICEALENLAVEFGGCAIDLRQRALSVDTDRIVLEGVDLGPFRLRLVIGNGPPDRPDLAIVAEALDPRPAACNLSHTHPHICDDRICLGEASLPLRAALQGGRVDDLFCILRSVLQTYNPDSPYVALEDWYGSPCGDCGVLLHEEDRLACGICEDAYCWDCMSSCNRCDEPSCLRCLSSCRVCDQSCCSNCLTLCPQCGQGVCFDCLQICPDCGQSVCGACLESAACSCQTNPEEPDHEDTRTHQQQEDCHPRQGLAVPAAQGPS